MIELGFADALFIYILLWLLGLAWLWSRKSTRNKRNEWHLSKTHLFYCNECHNVFVPKEMLNICRCPRCNTVCIRRRSNWE